MAWEVEFSDEFASWWERLNECEQDSVAVKVEVLQLHGPALGRPHVDNIRSSKHPHM